MGRPSNQAARRAQIVDATIRVMATTGFDAASTHLIAREAGLSTGLLHHHFPNKAAILESVVERLERRLFEREAKLRARARGPWGPLNAFIDAHLALGEGADPAALSAWVWIGAKALQGGALAQAYARVQTHRHARLVEIIRELSKRGGRGRGVPGMATDILCLIDGHYQLAATTELVEAGSAARRVRRSARLLLEVGVSP